MAQAHMSPTTTGVVLVAVAGLFYGLTKLYGSRIDREAGEPKRNEDTRRGD